MIEDSPNGVALRVHTVEAEHEIGCRIVRFVARKKRGSAEVAIHGIDPEVFRRIEPGQDAVEGHSGDAELKDEPICPSGQDIEDWDAAETEDIALAGIIILSVGERGK